MATTLDAFAVGTKQLCAMFGLPPSTLSTWIERDGMFFDRAEVRRGKAASWTLNDALRLALAKKLKEIGTPAHDACIVATAADPLSAFIAGGPVTFGFGGGRIANAYDPERDPLLTISQEQEGQALVVRFVHAMIAADGGPAAQAALDAFDARLRTARA